jgi:hypothetical protein
VIAHPFESTITKRTRNNSDFSYFVTKGNHLIEKETLNSMSTILFISEETDLEYFKKNGSILCKLVSQLARASRSLSTQQELRKKRNLEIAFLFLCDTINASFHFY